MPLPRNVTNCYVFERVELNVYDIDTKEIIFTGTSLEIANHLRVSVSRVRDALKRKGKLMRKYAIRTKSLKQKNNGKLNK